MNYVEKFLDGVQSALNLNASTFSGAIDIVAVEQPDGSPSLLFSPSHPLVLSPVSCGFSFCQFLLKLVWELSSSFLLRRLLFRIKVRDSSLLSSVTNPRNASRDVYDF